jgi:hypothetical protein
MSLVSYPTVTDDAVLLANVALWVAVDEFAARTVVVAVSTISAVEFDVGVTVVTFKLAVGGVDVALVEFCPNVVE